MLPYLELKSFSLGPLTIQVWGLLVALGILFGAYMSARFARLRGENPEIVWDVLPWLILFGIIGARLGFVLFYEPMTYLAAPLSIVRLWDGGMSIMGALVGGVGAMLWQLRKRRLNLARYADVLIFGLPFGKFIGRLGCFLIHDHPGTATHFLLGVKYPDGVVRHDLGLYLSLNGLVMGLFFLWLARKPRPDGTYTAAFAIWYGVVRFWLDFYRVADVRWGILTPAQVFCLPLIGFGVWMLLWIRKQT